MIYDCAVVIPTILRPVLARAVRSVYAQDFPGSVQVLVGIDVATGSRGILDELRAECPERMELRVVDLGYSTNVLHGGFYRMFGGGSLRTILSYAANSRYVAYLDDDNWWAPEHLSLLYSAVKGHAWAHSYRWYVHPDTQQPLCVDRWESVGAGRGMYAHIYKYNGHVDTNCLLLDKMKCHWVLPAWCIPHPHSKRKRGGLGGEDRSVFHLLQQHHRGACTGQATVYYVTNRGWLGVLRYLLERVPPDGLSPDEKRLWSLAARLAQISAAEQRQGLYAGLPPGASDAD